MKLTDAAIRGLKHAEKNQKFFDGGGLYLLVSPTGGKLWRLDYRFDGKRKTLALGSYPAVSLKDARQGREAAKEQLAKDIDPGAHKQAVKIAVQAEKENSFEVVAREWHSRKRHVWVPAHAEKILSRLETYIFPIVGGRPIAAVTAPELLSALRRIESRGTVETAHRTLQSCGSIFRFGIATGRCERDTAADLKDALQPVKHNNFPTITEPKAIGKLLRAVNTYHGNLIVRTALRISPYVFVRPGELRHAEWSEFDIDNAEWRIPAHKMKMRQIHIVPLARQVVSILEELHQFTGTGVYIFPGMRSSLRPISDATLINALRSMGYDKETIVVHSFRSMASTLLNEQGYNRDVIERQLAHSEHSVRDTYNYAQYLPERRRMMQEWADYLDSLRGDTTTA
jgi:integrase